MPTRKDNTNVAPIYRQQQFIPFKGAKKIMWDAIPKINGRRIASGAIDIVSPEFDLLTGIRGFATLKNLSINITSKNAHKIKDKAWDKLYNAAIDKGDVKEIKRLRDLHFQAKSRNNFIINEDGTPKHLYHVTKNKFNSFDLSKAGTGSGNLNNTEGVVYFSPYKEASLDVFRPKKSEVKDFNIMDLYVNNTNPVNVKLSDFIKTWNNKEEFLKLRNAGEGIIAKGVKTPQQYYDEAVKKYLEKEKSGNLSIFDRKPESVKEFMEEQLVDNYTINNPNNIKSAKAITYDNNGNLIPLSKRDNFNINDIRMKCGGRRRAEYGLDIQYGGRAIPIGRNMVYFDGNSHEMGGIGVGNKLEVEGGEVGEYKNNTLRVFSSVPFLRGVSPAQLVMGGANPNKVFKAQEDFKDRNRINDDGTHYQNGGQTKSNSAIRTEEDKKVSARNRAIYSAVDATSDYPAWWQAIGLGIGSNFKTIINPDSMNYTVTDSVADAAWRKRLGLSYDDKFLIPNKDGSVRLPRNVEMEIPTDTTMLKKRIAANEKFANQSNIVGEDWQIVQAMMKKDKEALEALRKTYKTGEPVVVNEYAHNTRKLSKNGELIDNAINYKSPLNIMRNYTIQYDPKTRKMNYWDTYDFNEFEWGVPGKPFDIRGSIPLKRYGGNMIYTINGNVKNGLMSARPKAEFGKDVKYPHVDGNRKYYINNGAKIYSDGQIVDEKGYGKYYVFRDKNRNFLGYSIDENGNRELAPVFNEKIAKETYEYSKNKRPQYYAEKKLPIAGSKSVAEKAGLARSGWSYADNPTLDYVPKINISVPTNYAKAIGDNAKTSTSSTPRGRGTNTSKATASTKPAAVETKQPKLVERPKENLYITGIKNNAVKSPLMTGMEKISTKPASPSTGGETQPEDGRWVGQYKTTNVGDWIGLSANLAGTIGSYFINKSSINKMPDPIKPVMAQAAKLKTRYNIEPQLTNIREVEQMNRAAVRRNTQSSNTSLAREQRLLNESRGARNVLYGQKENIETQLINQDKLNRQTVNAQNVATYNDYLTRLYAGRVSQNQARISNINNLLSGLTGSVNNILGNIESRRMTNNTIRAIAAANPNVDARLIGGFDYYIDPVTKKKYNKNQQLVGTING